MSLEEEIESTWEELQDLDNRGMLEKCLEILNFEITCSDLDYMTKKSRTLRDISNKLEDYLVLTYPGPKREEIYRKVQNLKEKTEEKKHEMYLCIKDKIYRNTFFEREEESLKEIAKNIGDDYLVSLIENPDDERFQEAAFRADYDREYFKIKRKFDKTKKHDRKSLKEFKKLAQESETLSDKYKSINDNIGASKAAVLHEDIEKAAQNLTPIYESWKKRRITVGLAILATFFGFWKGHYVKEQAKYFFSKNPVEHTVDSMWSSYSGPVTSQVDSYLQGINGTSAYLLYASLDDSTLILEGSKEDSTFFEMPITSSNFKQGMYIPSKYSFELSSKGNGLDYLIMRTYRNQLHAGNDSTKKYLTNFEQKMKKSIFIIE